MPPGAWSRAGSERHRLGAALDLAPTVGAQRVDRRARQGVVVGEEPAQDLLVGVAAVAQHLDGAGQPLDHGTLEEEGAGHRPAVALADAEQLTLLDHLADAGAGHPETLGDLGERDDLDVVAHDGGEGGLGHADTLPEERVLGDARQEVSSPTSTRVSPSGSARASRCPPGSTTGSTPARSRASRTWKSAGKKRSSRPMTTLTGTSGH